MYKTRLAVAIFNIVIEAIALFIALYPSQAPAQCRQLFRQQVVQSYVVPVQQVVALQNYSPHYQNQNIRYFLGEDLQVQALAQKITSPLAQELAPILAPLVARELQKLQANGGGNNNNAPPVPGDSGNNGGLSIIDAQKMPLFATRCARCHTGDNPSSGISFDNGVSDKSFRKFVRMFQSNTFPKPMQFMANLTPELKGAITEELNSFAVSSDGVDKAKVKPEVVLPPKPMPPIETEGDLK